MGTKILMVEHDQDDRWLTEETFHAEGFEGGIDFICGAELSEYLFKIKSFINYWFHTVELPA